MIAAWLWPLLVGVASASASAHASDSIAQYLALEDDTELALVEPDLRRQIEDEWHSAVSEQTKGDFEAAERSLLDIEERAPEFAPAFRRRCEVLRELDAFDAAIVECQRAVMVDPSAINRAVLAGAFAQSIAPDTPPHDRDKQLA
jgi:hypothetical protein